MEHLLCEKHKINTRQTNIKILCIMGAIIIHRNILIINTHSYSTLTSNVSPYLTVITVFLLSADVTAGCWRRWGGDDCSVHHRLVRLICVNYGIIFKLIRNEMRVNVYLLQKKQRLSIFNVVLDSEVLRCHIEFKR